MEITDQKIHRIAAKLTLILTIILALAQLFSIYQNKRQLVSPVVPQNLVWTINKQFAFKAAVYFLTFIVGLVLYLKAKFVWAIILAVAAILITRFIYIP